MTKVFVHGNPETAFVWSELASALRRCGVDDLLMLSPPGFGAPVPKGFEPTRLNYRDWLIAELENLGGEIDLVGHDWGAGHVYAVAAARPDLLRSWAADCAGLLHTDYRWHRAAQVWQTPGDGEDSITAIIALNGEQLSKAFGVPARLATEMAQGLDAEMGRCILTLYRSAVQPALRELGDQLAAAKRRPALLLHATNDPFVPAGMAFDVAKRIDAKILTLSDLGHWWMFEDADTAAKGLAAFWSALAPTN
jgi:pimeloyl-ACP methyl ester carboxylesterase